MPHPKTTVPNVYYIFALPAYTAPVWVDRPDSTERDIANHGDVALWSGSAPPPAIGTRVEVTMNGLGHGIVRAYFTEHGWLGIRVELEKPPAWWIKQNKGVTAGPERWSHIFGVEFGPEKPKRKRRTA